MILPYPIAFFLAWGFLALLCFILFLNIFGLPANWLIFALAILWKVCIPDSSNMGVIFWILLTSLAIAGEVLELGLQIFKARTCGSTSSGTFAGMVCAFIGAIICAPFFWGLGAFLGALAGAWIGCYSMELLKGRTGQEALKSAWGAMLGRFLGTTCKIGIGAAMIALIAGYILPESPEYEPVINSDDIVAALDNLRHLTFALI